MAHVEHDEDGIWIERKKGLVIGATIHNPPHTVKYMDKKV